MAGRAQHQGGQNRGQGDDGTQQNTPFQRSSQPQLSTAPAGRGLMGMAEAIQQEERKRRSRHHHHHHNHPPTQQQQEAEHREKVKDGKVEKLEKKLSRYKARLQKAKRRQKKMHDMFLAMKEKVASFCDSIGMLPQVSSSSSSSSSSDESSQGERTESPGAAPTTPPTTPFHHPATHSITDTSRASPYSLAAYVKRVQPQDSPGTNSPLPHEAAPIIHSVHHMSDNSCSHIPSTDGEPVFGRYQGTRDTGEDGKEHDEHTQPWTVDPQPEHPPHKRHRSSTESSNTDNDTEKPDEKRRRVGLLTIPKDRLPKRERSHVDLYSVFNQSPTKHAPEQGESSPCSTTDLNTSLDSRYNADRSSVNRLLSRAESKPGTTAAAAMAADRQMLHDYPQITHQLSTSDDSTIHITGGRVYRVAQPKMYTEKLPVEQYAHTDSQHSNNKRERKSSHETKAVYDMDTEEIDADTETLSSRSKKLKKKDRRMSCESKESKEPVDMDTVEEANAQTDTVKSRKKKLKKKRRDSKTTSDAEIREHCRSNKQKAQLSSQRKDEDLKKKIESYDTSDKKTVRDSKSHTVESDNKNIKTEKPSASNKSSNSVDSSDSDVPIAAMVRKRVERQSNEGSRITDTGKQTAKQTMKESEEESSQAEDDICRTARRKSRRISKQLSSSQASDDDEVFASPRRSSRLQTKNIEHSRKQKKLKHKMKQGSSVELSSECSVVYLPETSLDKDDPCKVTVIKESDEFVSCLMEGDKTKARNSKSKLSSRRSSRDLQRTVSKSSESERKDLKRKESVHSVNDKPKHDAGEKEQKTEEQMDSIKDKTKQDSVKEQNSKEHGSINHGAKETSENKTTMIPKLSKETISSEKSTNTSESSVSSDKKSERRERNKNKKQAKKDTGSHTQDTKSSKSEENTKELAASKHKVTEKEKKHPERIESSGKDAESSCKAKELVATESGKDAIRKSSKHNRDEETKTKARKDISAKEFITEKKSKSESESEKIPKSQDEKNLDVDAESKSTKTSGKRKDPEKETTARKETASSEMEPSRLEKDTEEKKQVTVEAEQALGSSPENKENKPERSNSADGPTKPSTEKGRYVIPKKPQTSQETVQRHQEETVSLSSPSTSKGRFVIPKKPRTSQTVESTKQDQDKEEEKEEDAEEEERSIQAYMLAPTEPRKSNDWADKVVMKEMSVHHDVAPTKSVTRPQNSTAPSPSMSTTEKLIRSRQFLSRHEKEQAIANRDARKVRDRLISERQLMTPPPATEEEVVTPTPQKRWKTRLSDDEAEETQESKPESRSIFEERAIMKSDRHQDLKHEILVKKQQDVAQHMHTALAHTDAQKEAFMDVLKLSPRKVNPPSTGLYGSYTTSKDSAKFSNPVVARAVEEPVLRRSPRKSVKPQLFQSHEAGCAKPSPVLNIMNYLHQQQQQQQQQQQEQWQQQPTTCPSTIHTTTANDIMKLLQASKTPENPQPVSKPKTPGNDTLERIYDEVTMPDAITPLKPTPPDQQITPAQPTTSTPVLQLVPLAPQPQGLSTFKIPKLVPNDPRHKPESTQPTREPRIIASEAQRHTEHKAQDPRQRPGDAKRQEVKSRESLVRSNSPRPTLSQQNSVEKEVKKAGKGKTGLKIAIEKPGVPLPSTQELFSVSRPAVLAAQADALPSPASIKSNSPSWIIDTDRDTDEEAVLKGAGLKGAELKEARDKSSQGKDRKETHEEKQPKQKKQPTENIRKTDTAQDPVSDKPTDQQPHKVYQESATNQPTVQASDVESTRDVVPPSPLIDNLWYSALGGSEAAQAAEESLSNMYDDVPAVDLPQDDQQHVESNMEGENIKNPTSIDTEADMNSEINYLKESTDTDRQLSREDTRASPAKSLEHRSDDRQTMDQSPSKGSQVQETKLETEKQSEQKGIAPELDSITSKEDGDVQSKQPVSTETTTTVKQVEANSSQEQQNIETTDHSSKDACKNSQTEDMARENDETELEQRANNVTSTATETEQSENDESAQKVADTTANISSDDRATATIGEQHTAENTESMHRKELDKEKGVRSSDHEDSSSNLGSTDASSSDSSSSESSSSESSSSESSSSESEDEKEKDDVAVIELKSGSESSDSDSDSDDKTDDKSNHGSSSTSSSSSEDSDSDNDKDGSGSSSGDKSGDSESSDSSSDEDNEAKEEEMEVTDKGTFYMVSVSPHDIKPKQIEKASPMKKIRTGEASQSAALKPVTPKKTTPKKTPQKGNRYCASVAPEFHPSPQKYKSPLKNFKALLTPRKLDAAAYSPSTRARMQEAGELDTASRSPRAEIVDCDDHGSTDKKKPAQVKDDGIAADSNDAEVETIMEKKRKDSEVPGDNNAQEIQNKPEAVKEAVEEETEDGELKDESQDAGKKEPEKQSITENSVEFAIDLHCGDSMFNEMLGDSLDQPPNVENVRKPLKRTKSAKRSEQRSRARNRARGLSQSQQNQAMDQSPESRARDRSPESRARGRSPESRARDRSPESRARGRSPESRARDRSSESRARGRSPDSRARDRSPESRARGRSPESRARGRSPESRARGRSPESRARDRSSESRARGRSPENRRKNIRPSPPSRARSRSPLRHARGRSPETSFESLRKAFSPSREGVRDRGKERRQKRRRRSNTEREGKRQRR